MPVQARKFNTLVSRLPVLLLAAVLAVGGAAAPTWTRNGVGAQSLPPNASRIELSGLDISHFPEVSAYLDVHGPEGAFIDNLTPANLTVLEDDAPAPTLELTVQEPGVRVMVAINAGPGLAIRNVQGVTRFDQITWALQAWAERIPTGQTDEYALFDNQSGPLPFTPNPSEWLTALNAYKPDLRSVQPSLASLTQALDMSSEMLPRFGMEKTILFITPVIEGDSLSAAGDTADRARQAGIHINVWMVAGGSALESKGAIALRKMAADTGGSFFHFTGTEEFPDIEGYLKALRSIYTLRYTSQVKSGGSHSLLVRIQQGDFKASTPLMIFSIQIQEPNPIFLSPPAGITRESPAVKPSGGISSGPVGASLEPRQQTIEIMVEFPDGHPRALTAARLFVDGKLVAENTQEPFTRFTWDLSGYSQSGKHILTAEVQDVLGLANHTIDTPVEVKVVAPIVNVVNSIQNNNMVFSLAATGLAGLAMAVVLALGWRWRVRSRRAGQGSLADSMEAEGFSPKTRPSRRRSAAAEEPTRPSWAAAHKLTAPRVVLPERPVWPRPETLSAPAARLIRLGEECQPVAGNPLPVVSREITFGRDPALATCILDMPSVEALHARLRQVENGHFWLSDEGSVAGTWINFAPVSKEGTQIEHGDITHIGRAAFRFQLEKPGHIRKPTIRTYKDNL